MKRVDIWNVGSTTPWTGAPGGGNTPSTSIPHQASWLQTHDQCLVLPLLWYFSYQDQPHLLKLWAATRSPSLSNFCHAFYNNKEKVTNHLLDDQICPGPQRNNFCYSQPAISSLDTSDNRNWVELITFFPWLFRLLNAESTRSSEVLDKTLTKTQFSISDQVNTWPFSTCSLGQWDSSVSKERCWLPRLMA